jgi:LPS sulfotransferase NodH
MLKERPPIEYNRLEIDRRLKEIEAQENAYQSFFVARQLTALEIWYEDLIADPDAVCKTVCRYVDVEPAYTFDLPKAKLQRLTTAPNEEWKQRFVSSNKMRCLP